SEGEKDCDTLAVLGFTATCNPMGAGKWRDDYNAHFAGKRVVIIPDGDKPGRDHAEQVARALYGVAASVRIVALPGTVNDKAVKDASDFVATFADKREAGERLAIMAEGAAEWRPVDTLDQAERKANAGERPLIEFCSPAQLRDYQPPEGSILVGENHIVKGGVFVIGGAPGVGKSRAAVALAVAGATEAEWFGLKVHRRFCTVVGQTENRRIRL